MILGILYKLRYIKVKERICKILTEEVKKAVILLRRNLLLNPKKRLFLMLIYIEG